MRGDERSARPIGMICRPIRDPSVFAVESTSSHQFISKALHLRVSKHRFSHLHNEWFIEFETTCGTYRGSTPDVDFLEPIPPLEQLAEAAE